MNISAMSSSSAAGLAEAHSRHSLAASQKLANELTAGQQSSTPGIKAQPADQNVLREKFDAFVGESFYSQMLSAMHKTVGKTPYFNGGRAEETFQGQLDQVMSQDMAKANGSQFSGAMFNQFNLQLHSGDRQ